MKLSKETIAKLGSDTISVPSEGLFDLPEKVLQFGTGVLLRGLPDYYIDKANKQGIFKGRVVIVKSTEGNEANAFNEQDGLFTHCIRGLHNGQMLESFIVNSSVSRVLTAKTQWAQILECAANPQMQIIISNTTEVGIVLMEEDVVTAVPPVSFPGKLLAFLLERYKIFNGDETKGMVILPTELITDNGSKLQSIVMELAHLNKLDYGFIDWLENANTFCNTLVDRIVPGKLDTEQQQIAENKIGYKDPLLITSEVYGLWAIETLNPKVTPLLSFAQADEGIVITKDINKFRELKLRLLNGTHTYSAALAVLAGFDTVKNAMDNPSFFRYVQELMKNEIGNSITGSNISQSECNDFADSVLERFANPFIKHMWLSITLNYTHKMKMRNVPLLVKYYEKHKEVPRYMALGFAAYMLFMKCSPGESGNYYGEANGKVYAMQDEEARWFSKVWQNNNIDEVVKQVLSNEGMWNENLYLLDGFAETVANYIVEITEKGAMETLQQFHAIKHKVVSYEA